MKSEKKETNRILVVCGHIIKSRDHLKKISQIIRSRNVITFSETPCIYIYKYLQNPMHEQVKF